MGSTDEPNKHSNLENPSSSPTTQPLLSKPPYSFPSPIDEPPSNNDPTTSEPDPNHYLQISYNYGRRPIKDLSFLIVFALFVLSTFAFGIFASVNRNPNSSNISSFVYDSNSSSCVDQSSSTLSSIDTTLSFYYYSSSSSGVLKYLIWTLVITLILSVPFALCVLLLLKHYTKQIVYISLPFFVIVPIFINVYWFVACTVSSTCSDAFPLAYRILVFVFLFLIVGVIVWIFVVNWHRIELTVSIIGVASNALLRNLRLFGVLPALTLSLFVYYAPIVVFLVLARQNGEIVVREESEEYYCAWKQDSWVPAYYALAILTMLWSAAAMVEAQAYVISGTIAQWYFSKDDLKPRKSIRSSLRNAFGPSSGTVCLSGLLICVVRVVRAVVDIAQEEAPGMLNLILRCCVNTLLTAIDFLNKFTINFAAITGEAYCTSARMTYELLKRNLLSAVFVEIVSTRILAGICLVLSAIYAIVVYAIVNAASNLGVDSYFVAVMAWVLLTVVLGFFVHVLDNVIDTVYVCYAIDKDKGEVYKQEVHEVYVHLPISRNHRSSLDTRTPLV
ncbi:uncharacterized protein LOC132293855 [Cornus florida]|uniref:uncharacterized protein LOC132293855 n=1 Tax=Cornus florida TaxID=4283 RepID=UPI00289B0F7D|nr:uncharacterized protein LOC132293855 [Cornus florida]